MRIDDKKTNRIALRLHDGATPYNRNPSIAGICEPVLAPVPGGGEQRPGFRTQNWHDQDSNC
jgi:hypothetical protein